ncbi:unnamed protein product [Adineta ricciae]|uniref:Uncharacterized protein n=1 Tax=Adineta ricciae TaxID=249248 RepID=A0A815G347_ADIRI|nr:unnamed protein product [Adineta ricciae]
MDFFRKFRQSLLEWNLFFPEEDEYDDDDGDEHLSFHIAEDQLQHQRISTRLYVLLLNSILFILLVFTLLQQQTKIITINQPSIEVYRQLQFEYSDTLNCPCSALTILYETFTNIQITFHQICSSIFVTEQWISSLFFSQNGLYLPIDFRTTGSSQFKLLRNFCKFAQTTTSDMIFDINKTQLISPILLLESQLDSQIQNTVELIKYNWAKLFINTLQLSILNTRTNKFMSALNTNYLNAAVNNGANRLPGWYRNSISWYLYNNTRTTICDCDNDYCQYPAGFYPMINDHDAFLYWYFKPQNYEILDVIEGFMISCTTMESLLGGTLECLYSLKCVAILKRYFPKLNQTIFNDDVLNKSWLTRYSLNTNINSLLEEFFIEEFSFEIDYNQYFQRCSPNSCTYSYTKRADFIYMITILLGFYGSLQTVLRKIIPFLIKWVLKRKQHSANQNNHEKKSLRRLLILLKTLKTRIFKLNLFKTTDRSPELIQQQRITTRLYLVLLIGSIFILILFTILNKQTTIFTNSFPSYEMYQYLRSKHSNEITCSCSEFQQISSLFVTLIPSFHSICLSPFIEDIWIRQLKANKVYVMLSIDWRVLSFNLFQTLRELCVYANNMINDALNKFNQRTLISLNLLDENYLTEQVTEISNEFIRSLENDFRLPIVINLLNNQIDQYFSESASNGGISFINTTENGSFQVNIIINGISNSGYLCYCTFDPSCEYSMFVGITIRTFIPGFVLRCSIIDSLFHSSLQCLYSNSCLIDILFVSLNETSTYAQYLPPLSKETLFYFNENSTINQLIEKSFIDHWIINISYEKYFQACHPNFCSYKYLHRNSLSYSITIVLSLYGGLSFVLHFLTPLIIKTIKSCCYQRRQRQTNIDEERTSMIRCFLNSIQNFLKSKLLNLTLFRTSDFGTNTDRQTANLLNRIATRMYLCSLTISLIILLLYNLIEARLITEVLENPPLSDTEQLLSKYVDTAICRCTQISTPLNQLLRIHINFHQICSSTFVSDQWREALTLGAANIRYMLNKSDYRFYISAHLQFLSGLCKQSITQANNSINKFLSNSFITSSLLSKFDFEIQISNLFKQTISNAPISFVRLLNLIRSVNDGNALTTVYGNNYQFVVSEQQLTASYSILTTKSIVYNETEQCDCGFKSTCVVPARFLLNESLKIKGFYMGCLPSETLLISTLECFYDINCINHLRTYLPTNYYKTYAEPLNVDNSKFEMNETINNLLKELFVEEWIISKNYQAYFHQCAPNVCSYTYVQRSKSIDSCLNDGQTLLLITFGCGTDDNSNVIPLNFTLTKSHFQYSISSSINSPINLVNKILNDRPTWHINALDHTENDLDGYMLLVNGNNNELFNLTL